MQRKLQPALNNTGGRRRPEYSLPPVRKNQIAETIRPEQAQTDSDSASQYGQVETDSRVVPLKDAFRRSKGASVVQHTGPQAEVSADARPL